MSPSVEAGALVGAEWTWFEHRWRRMAAASQCAPGRRRDARAPPPLATRDGSRAAVSSTERRGDVRYRWHRWQRMRRVMPANTAGASGAFGDRPSRSLLSARAGGTAGEEEIPMGTTFRDREFERVEPAESAFRSPIPTQVISNGEFHTPRQTPEQKRVEARIKELADTYGKKLGMDRRRFLQTASGMAAHFVAMYIVCGKVFDVSEAEAADPMVAQARTDGTKGQFIMDVQTHWVRDDYNQEDRESTR